MQAALHSAASALRAYLAQYTQDTRLLRLTTSLGADRLLVERIEGHEGLSEGFRFTIDALSTDAQIDLNALLGQPALLEILTQHSRTALRPVHGHITSVERLGSDGGFARYRLTLEPWTAFLRHRHDAYVWQNATVFDILADIFSGYQGQGKLVPSWRLALADPDAYPPYDLRTQFEESDWAFVERLLADEGLFYWFEHRADAGTQTLGSHQLVIGDYNGAFAPNPQGVIRFHRADATEEADSITRWHAARRLLPNAVALASWNETLASTLEAHAQTHHDNGEAPDLAVIDYPGERRFATRDAAERAARRKLQAFEARNKTYDGVGTVRTLYPATTFVLTGHAVHDADRRAGGKAAATFAVISVRHRARNNLSSQARLLIEGVFAHTRHAPQDEPDNAPLYENRFTALRADVPWRPLTEDGRGALLHPKPTVTGVQTGIVVGESGSDLNAGRDHRVQVQMHWQRGSRSSSRRAHPQGDDNAPGNSQAYIWVRVAEKAAGPNWGSAFLPRIGQEVLLDYVEGDIDRPLVIGSLYNGKGQEDAPGNQVNQGAGAATGNAPAWFAGSSGDHAHNAILSGFKTQEIGHSQDGQGGYNQLVFDDTTGQVGVRLHSTQHTTQLNLGHIKRQRDNERKQSHGLGTELSTEAYGAVRAGQGLLISADARPHDSGAQMDAREAHEQLQQAHALQQSLAESAEKHLAFAGKTFDKERHEQPEKALSRPIASLEQTAEGTGTPEGGGAGAVPVFGRPDLVISAPAGIAMLTAQDLHAAAGSSVTLTGGVDVSATVGQHLAAAVKDGISLFTYGDAKAKRKEQGDKGIKLHAAQGKVAIQAQSAEARIAADKDVHITSTQAGVEMAAKEHVMLAAGGAYIKIAGGSIQIHAPGKVEFKATMKVLGGPASMTHELVSLPKGELKFDANKPLFSQQIDLSHLAMNEEPGFNSAGKTYWAIKEDGTFMTSGTTSKEGLTDRIFANETGRIKVAVEAGDWQVEERFEEDNDDLLNGGHEE